MLSTSGYNINIYNIVLAKTMISIIGAGPVGSYLGYILAKNGYKVDIYEEHKEIGRPVQCTGITTSALTQIIRPKPSFVINKIKKTRVYAPNNDFVEFRLKENLILDRAKFDQYIADMAEKHGANIYLGYKFLDFKKDELILNYKGKIKRLRTRLLVGADGPSSQVAKSFEMWGKREFFIGLQARAYLDNDNVVEFYLGIGDFAWVVPESKKVVRIGLVARKNPNFYAKKRQSRFWHPKNTPAADFCDFKGFLQSKLGKDYEKKVIEKQGGLIPVYNPRLEAQKGNVFLVGDAATMVKATTAGGIIQGLTAANVLADSIMYKKDYQKEWKRKIGKDLYLSLVIRRVLDKFSDDDYNLLIKLVKKQGIVDLLERYDRDYPTKMLPKLMLETIKEPRLLLFARHLSKITK